MLGEGAAPADVAGLRKDLGLDRPLLGQYVSWLSGALRGDLGSSILTRRKVTREILAAVPATAELAFAAFLGALLVAVPTGVASALARGKPLDGFLRAASLLGRLDAELRLGAAPRPRLLDRSRPPPCVGARRARRPRPAGGHARVRARGAPVADGEGLPRRGDGPPVRRGRHRARRAPAPRDPAPRGAQRAPAGPRRRGPAVRLAPDRRRRDGDDLLVARSRAAPRPVHPAARLPARAGLRPLHRRDVHPRERDRGRARRGARPARARACPGRTREAVREGRGRRPRPRDPGGRARAAPAVRAGDADRPDAAARPAVVRAAARDRRARAGPFLAPPARRDGVARRRGRGRPRLGGARLHARAPRGRARRRVGRGARASRGPRPRVPRPPPRRRARGGARAVGEEHGRRARGRRVGPVRPPRAHGGAAPVVRGTSSRPRGPRARRARASSPSTSFRTSRRRSSCRRRSTSRRPSSRSPRSRSSASASRRPRRPGARCSREGARTSSTLRTSSSPPRPRSSSWSSGRTSSATPSWTASTRRAAPRERRPRAPPRPCRRPRAGAPRGPPVRERPARRLHVRRQAHHLGQRPHRVAGEGRRGLHDAVLRRFARVGTELPARPPPDVRRPALDPRQPRVALPRREHRASRGRDGLLRGVARRAGLRGARRDRRGGALRRLHDPRRGGDVPRRPGRAPRGASPSSRSRACGCARRRESGSGPGRTPARSASSSSRSSSRRTRSSRRASSSLGELFRGGRGRSPREAWAALPRFARWALLGFLGPIVVLFAVRVIVIHGFLVSREAGIFDLENPLVAMKPALRGRERARSGGSLRPRRRSCRSRLVGGPLGVRVDARRGVSASGAPGRDPRSSSRSSSSRSRSGAAGRSPRSGSRSSPARCSRSPTSRS